MVTFIKTAINVALSIAQILFGKGGDTGQLANAIHQVAYLTQNLFQINSLYAWVFERQVQAFVNSDGRTANAASQYKQAFSEVNIALSHVVDVILPHSLKYLYGHIGSHVLQPIKRTISTLGKAVGDIDTRLRAVERWRSSRADPLLTDYNNFSKWWNRYFANIANTLVRWFDHPSEWTDWLAAPMAGSLLGWLTDGNHEQTADNYTLAWINRTPVWQTPACSAVLALLNEPWSGG